MPCRFPVQIVSVYASCGMVSLQHCQVHRADPRAFDAVPKFSVDQNCEVGGQRAIKEREVISDERMQASIEIMLSFRYLCISCRRNHV